MMAIARRTLFLGLALAIVFIAFAGSAAARTYNGGHTVFFSDETIGDGDEVRGDLAVVFGDVTCSAGGVIDGNVRTYFGNFTQLDGCRVGGRVISAFEGDEWSVAPFVPHWTSFDLALQNRRIFRNLAWDVVILFVFLLFPLRVRIALDRVERHPGWSAAAGMVALIAFVPIFIVLLLSIVGIPLLIVEAAAYFAGICIGWAALAMLVGRRLCELIHPRATPSPLLALVVGLVIVSAAQTLPLVGWAVTALALAVGLGATILGFMRESGFHGDIGGVPMNRPA